ncbi:MAG TPA: hypothetical protein VJ785_17865 [Anaerolineales bacterium]|nr:hypothetical protein [Anaerolineales bacterium]
MKQRDIELLSSYLDGQLSAVDSARLEARLRTEPDLRSVLQDLRGARSLLRQLPMRKAPRSFRLTPQMVGKDPPLPRSYPVFKFATTLATVLLFFTFGLNFLGPQLASQPPAFGMGGGAPDTFSAESAQLATEPLLAEMPATEAPAATEEPSAAMAPLPTASAPAQDTARAMETAVTKNADTEDAVSGAEKAQSLPPAAVEPAKPVSSQLQWILAGVALLGAFVMAMMRQLAANRWQGK